MIRKKKGVHIDSDIKIVADGKADKEAVNLVSHAHADHSIKKGAENVSCSSVTEKLIQERFDTEISAKDFENIQLMPSGHILGSSAALIDGKTLYTGDVSMQDRVYMEGFNPVNAEELIVEATYGIPSYRLPDQEEVVAEIQQWLNSNPDETVFLFGYSLGKAQKIQNIVQKSTERDILAHGAIMKMNKAVEQVTDLEFKAEPYTDNKENLDQKVVVAPSRSSRSDWIEKQVKRTDGVKAGFSGWAINESFKHRGEYDETFPLSDHCGFDDLVRLVREVDPEKVYTHHGFDEAFASHLRKEYGYNARALKNNQSSLKDF